MLDVKGCALVRVLAIAHVLCLDELAVEGAWESNTAFSCQLLTALVNTAQVIGDHAIVGGGVFEGLERQIKTLGVGQAAALERSKNAGVITGVDHNRHVLVILGRAADHGRATDVDIFNRVGQAAVGFGNRSSEGIQVDHDHVDRLDAVLLHHLGVQITSAEDATVDFRVQGLDPAIHHFRESGVVGHFDCVDGLFAKQLEGATRGEDLHALGCKFTGKINNPGFVRYADERATYRQAGGLVGHIGS